MELIEGVYMIPVIIAVVEVAKGLGFNQKFAPVLAVILGQIFAFGVAYFGNTVEFAAMIQGLVGGLGAVGLYSGVKNVREGLKK